jgi:predicted NAD/FAD-binding protein
MTACSSDSDLTRLQAEIGAAPVSSEPDHSVSVDLEDFKYLALVGLQSNLIFLRQPSSARCD